MAIIKAGYDLLSVVDGSTSINLDRVFPGAGIIYSDGVHIDPKQLGTFTTGLIRKTDLPDGESGTVAIEWFAEHSVSTHPVKLAPFGLGDGEGEFHTLINLGGVLPNLPNTDGHVRPSQGVMAIRRWRPGGGTFELLVNINPLIVITKPKGNISRLDGPDVLKTFDGSGLLNPVSAIGGQWSETAHKSRAIHSAAFSHGGSFFAALDRTNGEATTAQLVSGALPAERGVVAALRI